MNAGDQEWLKARELRVLGDDRGSLVALEEGHDVPFAIRRVYYIFGTTEGVGRGFHAHRQLHQMAVCVRGSCVMLMDDGTRRGKVLLDRPNLAIHIRPMIWHEMHELSEDCVLLVLASAPYDEADYIRNYDHFAACVRLESR